MAMRWPGVSASTSAAAAAHFPTRLCFAATDDSVGCWVSATVGRVESQRRQGLMWGIRTAGYKRTFKIYLFLADFLFSILEEL